MDNLGLLPKIYGWHEWFAWYPVLACGRWHWLSWVQRRHFWKDNQWEYCAGRSHDYMDGDLSIPAHFYIYVCTHCKAKFSI